MTDREQPAEMTFLRGKNVTPRVNGVRNEAARGMLL